MSTSDTPNDGSFEVSPDPATLAAGEQSEGANVLRITALATLFGPDPRAPFEVARELEGLGYSSLLVELAPGSRERDEQLLGLDWGSLSGEGSDSERVERWVRLNGEPTRHRARAFAMSMLPSDSMRESAAAAAVIWRELADDRLEAGAQGWRPPPFGYYGEPFEYRGPIGHLVRDLWSWLASFRDPDVDDGPSLSEEAWHFLLLDLHYRSRPADLARQTLELLTRWRLEKARRSADPVARSLAAAVLLPLDQELEPPDLAETCQCDRRGGPGPVSTIVHGTWGWKGRWWRPSAEFHDFILENHRPDLYARGAHFSWSGAYSRSQRILASKDLCGWAAEIAPAGLRTLFGHSYGGEIVARAQILGAPVEDLVFLSTPANSTVRAAARAGTNIVDVRLRFDPVLALARTRQRLPQVPNVTEVLLNAWRLDHGATHEVHVWQHENIASRGGL